jgi:hypothetical protein
MGAVAWLGGCKSRPADVYDVPVAQAYEKLSSATLDDFRAARQCGLLIHIRPLGSDDRSVTWTVTSSNVDVLNFSATLTPVSAEETKVDIEIQKEDSGHEMYDGSHIYKRPAVRYPTRPAITEAITSILEGRPYDEDKVPRINSEDSVCNAQRGILEENGTPLDVNANDQYGHKS